MKAEWRTVKPDEPLDPVHVGLLAKEAVVLEADRALTWSSRLSHLSIVPLYPGWIDLVSTSKDNLAATCA